MAEEAGGKVYLVGAGPGDPGLITVRGAACLSQAEVVVYDALVHPELLRHAAQAEHIFAGKKCADHSLPQEDIAALLVALARRHRTVVRLKGGDPFVFGRGGEEALALAAAGIPFEVVPGVTAGLAAAAYAGIPATHRGLAGSVSLITGHHRAGGADALGLDRLAREGTLIFYMGSQQLEAICAQLIALGRSAETPAAVVGSASYARQQVVTGRLADIAERVRCAGVEAPTVFLVGEVVALREHLAWFEARPLHGLRIAVTHTARRAGPLESALMALGAEVQSFPTLEIVEQEGPPFVWRQGVWDWVVLTSTNGAEALFDALDAAGGDARLLAGTRLCTSGQATATVVERRFLRVDARVSGSGVEGVLAALGAVAGQRILLPRADIARRRLAETLRAAGAEVEEIAAYRTRPATDVRDRVAQLLAFGPELVVFTNSSAVRHFATALEPETLSGVKARCAFASIGPVTSATAREQGLEIAIEPQRHEIAELVEAICGWWSLRRS